MKKYQYPEILAPCGTMAAFRAALSAGADAMYMALKQYGARAYAANFELSELLQVIEEAHLHERKIYLTLNTLLTDEEMRRIPEVMDPLYHAGLDAVLVQDFGLARFLRERYPKQELHASTQMNICSVPGARYAKELGFTRVVPARELSLAELSEIRDKVGIEVEAFVHGAMCYCYSGRCYLSSFLGGRSGNRGKCAQPCRRKWDGSYRLSMKDLCTLKEVPDLIAAGIDSLKIEGRMKNEYYAAACVDAYKTMVEDVRLGVFSEEKAARYEERLAEVFNRGGFTHGYLKQHSGPDMLDENMPGRAGVPIGEIDSVLSGKVRLTTEKDLNRGDALEIRISPEKEPIRLTLSEGAKKGTEVMLASPGTRMLHPGLPIYRVRNARLMAELENRFIMLRPRIPLRLTVTLSAGQPVTILGEILREDPGSPDGVTSTGENVYLTGAYAEQAKERPMKNPVIEEKIGTLADTDFELRELVIQNDNLSFIPAGEIKRLRRECLEILKKKRIERGKRIDERPIYIEETPEAGGKVSAYEKEKSGTPEISGSSLVSHMRKGPVCMVTSIAQARFLMLLPKKPSAIIFRNDLSLMDMGELRRFAASRGDVRFFAGFPAIYRTLISNEFMESLYNTANMLDGVYLPGVDSYAWYIERAFQKAFKKDEQDGFGRVVILGEALYRYNTHSTEHFRKDAGKYGFTLITEAPYELPAEKTEESDIRLVYGRIPLMHTAQNAAASSGFEGAEKQGLRLSGEGELSLLLYQNPKLWYNTLLSGLPVISDPAGQIPVYLFTTEDEKEMERVLSGAGNVRGIRHKGLA